MCVSVLYVCVCCGVCCGVCVCVVLRCGVCVCVCKWCSVELEVKLTSPHVAPLPLGDVVFFRTATGPLCRHSLSWRSYMQV